MRIFRQLISTFFVQLLLLLFLFTIMRGGFYFANSTFFATEDDSIPWKVFLHGLRFDISATMILISPFAVSLLLISHKYKLALVNKLLLWVPVVVASLFEIADWMYFPFNHKRSTAEVLSLVTTQNDFWELLPAFLRDYYYLFIIAILLLSAYIYISNFLLKKTTANLPSEIKLISQVFFKGLYLVLLSASTVIGIRGGFQLVPINIRNAVEVVEAKYAPLVLNTPFSIIHTVANQHLPNLEWLKEEEMNQYVQVLHNLNAEVQFDPQNVMIIILESCSKDFTSLGTSGKSYTPFLDELMQHSIVFTEAYANGLHSAEGIPAILASMPSWMSENFTASAYGSNKIQGIASLLQPFNYKSAFFHGAHNGSMGFDVFSKNAGFQYYFGKNEFNDPEYYDGAWGIFDKPFFNYTLNKIDSLGTPFVHALFSISAHSPYALPKEDQHLATPQFPIYGTIQYTDEALKDFFKTAERKKWFQDTWFIITADHTSPMSQYPNALQEFNKYEIPLIFYHPRYTINQEIITEVVSQIDILPLILEKIHFPNSFFAFGHYDLTKGIGMMAELNNQFYVKTRTGCKFTTNDLNTDVNQVDFIQDCRDIQLDWKRYLSYRQKYNEVLIKNSIPIIK